MIFWMLENHIGIFPTFIPLFFEREFTTSTEHIETSPCSIFYIYKLIPLKNIKIDKIIIRGYQKLGNTRFDIIDFKNEIENDILTNYLANRIVNYNCYLETTLYFFCISNNQARCYKSTFSACKLLRKEKAFLYEEKIFGDNFISIDNQPSFEVEFKLVNLKEKEHHYNWPENRSLTRKINPIQIFYKDKQYQISTPQCIFCFRNVNDIFDFQKHINTMHLHYNAEIGYFRCDNVQNKKVISEVKKTSIQKNLNTVDEINLRSPENLNKINSETLKDLNSETLNKINPETLKDLNPETLKGYNIFLRIKDFEVQINESKNFVYQSKNFKRIFKGKKIHIPDIPTKKPYWLNILSGNTNIKTLECISRNIDEINDLSREKKTFAKDWNNFVVENQIINITAVDVKKFLNQRKELFILEFLGILYCKGVLSLCEILDIVS
ncbi:hypothetical protein DMUE_1238 [Dictyocoela muelleri]|nr:hypothetical protein DMUE_1238 [Dictyocoela muelleri]